MKRLLYIFAMFVACVVQAQQPSAFTRNLWRGAASIVYPSGGSTGGGTDATLRVWYQYNANNGTNYLDSTTNALHANSVNSPTWTNGTLSFIAASSQYTRTPNNAKLAIGTNNATWSAWVKSSDYSAQRMVVAKYVAAGNQREYQWSLESDGKFQFLSSPDGTSGALATTKAATAIPLNTWLMVAMVKSNTAITFYTNGIALANGSSGSHGTIYASTSDMNVGAYLGMSYWAGGMDDVRLYARALNSAEIVSNYTATAGTSRP